MSEVVTEPFVVGGLHRGEYPGAFPPRVEKIIASVVESPCLHLFSGSSLVGDVRVDIAHPNATHPMDVYEFIQQDDRFWRFVVLDPDYHISRKAVKLRGHARYDSVSGNVLARRLLEDYFRGHVENVVWFDLCAPLSKGFVRKKLWLYIQGGREHLISPRCPTYSPQRRFCAPLYFNELGSSGLLGVDV